ncbi:hypothetical protein EV189_0016 [Motilibacter rhizosphaerae]|uniref:Methyltransferase family protein n=1 Tax=Motilibacter rhizosphaerae TaxID=598652 RepID=A0A4V2F4X0_9ACTN|nr:class I SAM-dependent methyltransferase [Motilibacter rhizosphaerae]RZS90789.1 hypothetical protein EV189_0016 [Motilibacter rhizosphaerae]
MTATGERAPLVLDGIPYARGSRADLAAEALAAADDAEALAVLLRDCDDWWDERPPDLAEARSALAAPTMREAMSALRLGRVGDYFAHRWSDPVFLAGLALLRRVWPERGQPVREIACGTGVLLRQLALHGVTDLAGGDVVMAKLWLARQFVLPAESSVELACFDAVADPWPWSESDGGVLVCHDAFYFLPDPAGTARRLARAAGRLVVGGVPNRLVQRGGGGHHFSPTELLDLFPGAEAYDDDELVAEAVWGQPARPRSARELEQASSVSLVLRPRDDIDAVPDPAAPLPWRELRVNPLYGADGRQSWPSERYARDYAARSDYLPRVLPDEEDLLLRRESWARRRVLLDLPDRW